LSEIFYHKLHGTPLAVTVLLYIAEYLKCSQQSNREFCTFLTRTNFSFQKRTTVKVNMKQALVLQIYNNLQKGYVQIC